VRRIFLLSTRPAKIVAEIPIDRPRSARSREDIASIRNEIAGTAIAGARLRILLIFECHGVLVGDGAGGRAWRTSL